MTAMNIASARVNALVQQLAHLTGEDTETALERAVQKRLSRIAPAAATPDRPTAPRAFLGRVASAKVRDERQPDDIIGYGPNGLPG
jgi:hypothetical protein